MTGRGSGGGSPRRPRIPGAPIAFERLPFPGDPAGSERPVIACQLGRDPRGDVGVVVRCSYGLPAVVRTSPRLEDGTPFPTLYYLVCPVAVRAAGQVEGSGAMRRFEAMLRDDPALAESYLRAHDSYIARRDSLGPIDEPMSAGGMPTRVKCVHALIAHELAEGNPVGAMALAQAAPLRCPGPCCAGSGAGVARVAGHPGFGGNV